MKALSFKNWNIMRFLRLAIGAWALEDAFQNSIPLLGFLGALLVIMAVMNIGCCGINRCDARLTGREKNDQKRSESDYEEIT